MCVRHVFKTKCKIDRRDPTLNSFDMNHPLKWTGYIPPAAKLLVELRTIHSRPTTHDSPRLPSSGLNEKYSNSIRLNTKFMKKQYVKPQYSEQSWNAWHSNEKYQNGYKEASCDWTRRSLIHVFDLEGCYCLIFSLVAIHFWLYALVVIWAVGYDAHTY